ncbi:MAG: tRNA preQ1(34) S-adenosylmethionine ribosyltransferase-isomerase QueA [Deltaproteobacteria bacterium]|nr:tRNA preQ1(34) S-adenosylmethionine ribosyltransferase-isomerase QueA [Deltaproteobacteria bacterium]
MKLTDFDYDLPEGLIAQTPAKKRDGSRLMMLDRLNGGYSHHAFSNLPALLSKRDLVVINDTRVIPARLVPRKRTGGKVEILLVRRLPGPTERWECMTQASRGIREGTEVFFEGGERCMFEKTAKGGFCVAAFESRAAFRAIIQNFGKTPLPPYIRRERGPGRTDAERYQTVYARSPGSCAAPTAGLHFTDALLFAVGKATAGVVRLTLHVGPGTFLPVRIERVEDHVMHAEWMSIGAGVVLRLNRHRAGGGRVLAVGTTVARALEHAADEDGTIKAQTGLTDMFITPGYSFRAVDRLLTNFHLPRSTLLMLVCAFAGRDFTLRAYANAVSRAYRFYSYGDAMLIV